MSKTSPEFTYSGRGNAGSKQELRDWPEEELMQIRLVFKRLTALRVNNPDDVEDLVQEAFLTMTEKISGIEVRKGLMVWGMGILRKKVGNYYRRVQRATSLDQNGSGVRKAMMIQAIPGVDSGIHCSELQSLVCGILQALPPHERVVMELVLAGLSTGEIVGQLNSERYQNVVNRIYRAREKLHRALAKHGYNATSSRTANGRRRPAKP